ncbi:hypothetical protein EDD99_8133 [Streptomyces sp. 846.5]|nr:hypothetical protein [Streptomyces sp. 846.5]TDT93324.1 hypothetical protein EDD99_8133 [Streptomyces sp. 846.5]
MSRPPRRTAEIGSATAQLAVLSGTEPLVSEEAGAVRVEVEVTPALVTQWRRVLAVLDLGDSFGLTHTADGRTTAWLGFNDLSEAPRP